MNFLRRLIPRTKVDIEEKFVLITGCDSGFGRETAVRLDKLGACVLATCLTNEGEQSLKSVGSDRLKTFQMDVTSSQQIKEVYKEVERQIPSNTGLWGLVNNAGIAYLGPVEWTPLEQFKRTADVNLWGTIDVTKTFLPLVRRARGRVVNFSSVLGRVSPTMLGSYAVTKYGVQAFSDAFRREMDPWGTKVSIVEPGGFRTEIIRGGKGERQIQEGWDDLSDELKQEYTEKGIKLFLPMRPSPHTHKVVDAVVEALTSQSPRDRYLVGLDTPIYAWLARFPAVYADVIINLLSIRIPLPPKFRENK
ncbi:retinol dehydrogenase 2-like [Stylophora pistillata]|uniref:Retinol dehydrogenase 2 n=1 Tax=Stylophora pistillata TaxID=50429 RepID=A0A2B4SQD5_STYPI|nr:retinol dehydrogenase 2-like [Stylophora pistillata]PFX31090.1 Retinol dehydrogenase 2 [Stylophora pistillata]